MDLDSLKRHLQDHLTDDVVIIIGSGLSAIPGIPGMPQLAAHLKATIPARVSAPLDTEWKSISDRLDAGDGLEEALQAVSVSGDLEELIIAATASCISDAERRAIEEVVRGSCPLAIGRLFEYLLRVNASLDVITPNYDRLIETCAERQGLGVDTMFVGNTYGVFDPKLSRESLGLAKQTQSRKGITRHYRKHIRLHKPHGSLDWYSLDGAPIRCAQPIQVPRLMITPGQTKYVRGYEQPFDRHREAANTAIDRAARLLVIGYGFKDSQLETHLRGQLQRGIPCIIITRTLSPNALKLVSDCKTILAIERDPADITATRVHHNGGSWSFPDSQLWDLSHFISEALML